MTEILSRLKRIYLAAVILIGIAWIVDLPQYFGLSLIAAEWIGGLLGVGVAAALLQYPYIERFRVVDALFCLL